MIIGNYYNGLELHRKEKVIYGKMRQPHRTLSTCRTNGGLREDIQYLYNHQSCEPKGHTEIDLCEVAVNDPQRYHRRIARHAGIPANASAGLGTAANMNNAAIATETFEGLEVVAVSTAGVASNASRAGDPASYWQSQTGSVALQVPVIRHGTINTLLFINEELTPGSMVAAATVMAEAKAAALQELSVPSRYSERIATGTGTDQIGIACQLGSAVTHTDSNKHSKLGELIAKATRSSILESLSLQGGVNPDRARSCIFALDRFGGSKTALLKSVKERLSDGAFALFEKNFLSINHDPITVAAILAWTHLKDQIEWGVLPDGCRVEVLTGAASAVATAVAGKPVEAERIATNVARLAATDLLEVLYLAFALGFERKWADRFED